MEPNMFKKKTANRLIKYASDVPLHKLLPAKSVIPDWYKETPKHPKGSNMNQLPLKKSFKACSPFLDSFSTGYVLTTSCDLAVDNTTEKDTVITWNKDIGYLPIDLRSHEASIPNRKLPIPEGFSSQHFVWQTRISYTIPKGYSALLTHPLNRYDLPFLTLSGVIDGHMTLHFGNLPVFFNKAFNGIITQGTPYAQIILFKTEDWTSEEDATVLEQERINQNHTRSHAIGWYKNSFWRRKTYN